MSDIPEAIPVQNDDETTFPKEFEDLFDYAKENSVQKFVENIGIEIEKSDFKAWEGYMFENYVGKNIFDLMIEQDFDNDLWCKNLIKSMFQSGMREAQAGRLLSIFFLNVASSAHNKRVLDFIKQNQS